jgi:hypothetical protein
MRNSVSLNYTNQFIKLIVLIFRFEAGRWLDRYEGDKKVRLDLTPNVAVMGNDRGKIK